MAEEVIKPYNPDEFRQPYNDAQSTANSIWSSFGNWFKGLFAGNNIHIRQPGEGVGPISVGPGGVSQATVPVPGPTATEAAGLPTATVQGGQVTLANNQKVGAPVPPAGTQLAPTVVAPPAPTPVPKTVTTVDPTKIPAAMVVDPNAQKLNDLEKMQLELAHKDWTPANIAQFNSIRAIREAAAKDPSILNKPEEIKRITDAENAKLQLFPDMATGLVPEDVPHETKTTLQGYLNSVRETVDSGPVYGTTLRDYAADVLRSSGVSDAQARLLDVNKILRGGREDIKKELTAHGGLITESAVDALYRMRNKDLMAEKESLQDAVQSGLDYAKLMIDAGKTDISNAQDAFYQRTGLQLKMAELFNNMAKTEQDDIKDKQKMAKDQIDLAMQGNFWNQLKPEQQESLWKDAGLPGSADKVDIHKGGTWTTPYVMPNGAVVQNDLVTGEINVITQPHYASEGSGEGKTYQETKKFEDEKGATYFARVTYDKAGNEINRVRLEGAPAEYEKAGDLKIQFSKEVSALQPGQASKKDLEGYAMSIGLNPQDKDVQAVIKSAPTKSWFSGLTEALFG